MLSGFENRNVILSGDIHSFFKSSIHDAANNQGVETAPQTIDYVASVLAKFSRSERLYERTAEGVQAPVLACIYSKAVEAQSADERCAFMKRLGDVALFMSGMFADSFNRRLVDVDYCMSMGEGAYGWLSDWRGASVHDNRPVFAELAENFARIVDILNEISERSGAASPSDVLKLYDRWLKTGSERVAKQLRALGVEVNGTTSSHWH